MAVQLLSVAWQDPWAGPIEWTETADMSWFVVRNDVGFFAAVLPLALALALRPSRRGLDVLGAVAVVADVSVVVVYQSRGAAVAALLVLVAWAACVRRRAAIAVVGAALLAMLGFDAAAGFPLTSRVAETWVTRVHVWLAALQMFLDAPLLGHGPRSFGVLFLDYFGDLPLPGWLPSDPRFSPWAHNLWLETLAEQGVVGFGALVLLVALAARTAFGLARARDAETRRLGLGAAVALLAFCVEGLYELSFIRLWVVVVFFSLLGAIAALDAEASRDGGDNG
jgi:O-antigen ligase